MQQVLVGAVLVWDFGVRGEGSLPQRLLEVGDGGDFNTGQGDGGVDGPWPAQPQPMMPSLIGVDMGVSYWALSHLW